MSTPIRILMLEDRATDAELVLRELRHAGYDPHWTRVETEADFLAGLAAAPEVILADYSLPHFDGLHAVKLLRARDPDTPFILVSATIGEETVAEALKQGATDYVQKDKLARLGAVLARALKDRRLGAERRQLDRELRETEALYHSLVESLPQAVFRKDRAGRLTFANAHFCAVLGRTPAEVLGRTDAELFPPALAAKYRADDLRVMETGQPVAGEEENVGPNGQPLFVEVTKTPVRDAAGVVVGIQGVFTDITARRQAADVLARRAEELERFHRLSVGRELRMVELKQEVNELARLAGRPPPYETMAK